MTLQFILGNGASDHQSKLVANAQDWLVKSSKHEVYFLVPNYNKFEQEKDLLTVVWGQQDGFFATTRTQVFSFRRFAWFMLQTNPDYPKSSLSEAGAAMIFRQILLEHKEELTVLQGEISKTGFIQQLYSFYRELKEGNVTAADLTSVITLAGGKEDQQLKLKDLALVVSAFEEELVVRRLHSDDYLQQLKQHLEGKDLSRLLFIVSGFSRFSARELQLLSVLMQQGNLQVSLMLAPKQLRGPELGPLDLFYDSQNSYLKLKQAADAAKVETFFDQTAEAKIKPEPLKALLNYWEESQSRQTVHPKKIDDRPQLEIIKAESPREEITWAARSIRRKVVEGKLRYKDIQLLVRDMEVYSSLIPTIFQQHEVPYYLDQKLKMAQHPLVELLNALIAIKSYDYRLNDIMRLFRTELFMPASEGDWEKARDNFRNQVDVTENLALAYNFQGSFWRREADWEIISYDFEEGQERETSNLELLSNEVRRFFQSRVPTFFKKINNAADGQAAVKILYEFLKESGVETQLLAWRDQEIQQGNLESARNHEQTWNALMSLLDEYVMIYGETPFDWNVFQDIIKTGMANLTYSMIPTALDQVRVNDLELARPNQAKVTFAIGLNNQVFPAKVETTGLLSSEDKQLVNSFLDESKFLLDERTQGLNREPFYAYLTFLSGEEELHLSYAASVDTKKDLQISPYLQRIHQYLGVPIKTVSAVRLENSSLARVSTYRGLLGDLNAVYRLAQDAHQDTIPQSWKYFEQLLMNSAVAELTQKVLESLYHLNVPKALDKKTVQELYGENIYASVSRLENFHNCEFRYFATYGLRLTEREIYGLTPAAAGDFFHEALDQFVKALLEQKKTLDMLTPNELKLLTDEILERVLGEIRFSVLSSSARMNYLRYQLSQTIRKVSWTMQQYSFRTALTPLETEVLFGQIGGKKGIPGIELPLNSGGKLYVRGKIDRVDTTRIAGKDGAPDKLWLSVIDYKSGQRDFDVTEAYYGLAMQLLTYLDVAVTDSAKWLGEEKAHPAGAYYLHVQNPVFTKPIVNVTEETLKKFKYQGLFVDDPELFERFDTTLVENSGTSSLFPLKKTVKGTYSKASKDKFYSEDDLQLLQQHNRENMQQAGNRILSGEIALNPAYKNKTKIACNYCPFRSVCGFDVMLKENQYHRITKRKKEDILQELKEGGKDYE